ncbi:probable glycerol-3-phosphate phosphatase (glycerol-1-phosphatase) [Fusarium fujikuroi IMI 58289]|uniref:Probable glycerol-3-phosphate phosphatase (Glycerol-1-phosphatase) n=1 Tax=Gibberella fujikuroi (strain CBS 195.34 / IMI 58289 / NRRL A-6831) TaxID=1279085 RepID=S0DTM5_GIBF5|nr:probable glycerol-3-phosphate phosphatase (glycerol-1-phosphatase) [Fusarium fujikuroi IMI 58289]CCT65780.1 probable glycerol-3-phosphate phosphatase (glycerol-1-phosphatase) [Fusarium fujikuroi IMI 58289]SCN78632.1 probable glycerol-3-phosphate phosphatase (glycerol-1-phosphatase) [Fusarium fujikuroi]SCO33661.1 probable glycerol-3-phosphate phosphatase (glycerol-1-phosphatase) [Fusarium fujikuroi]SCV26296.1 probable glycerol-3-phosphate phosphatase (glycerol-1-phosphatase) [Fusarium fujikur
MGSTPDYTLPPQELAFDGFLFDMDGTIIDSTDAVVKHWETIGNEIGVAPEVILETSHGRRSIDILKILAPEKANWDYVRDMEGRLPKYHGHEAVEIPGARSMLEALIARSSPWAIVTSGTIPLVTGWLRARDLPTPPSNHLVTAESVENGKPDPACYRLGRERLGLQAEDAQVLVLEDSPAGIRAGKAAGCKVLGLVTSHTVEQVIAAEPDWVVRDLSSVKVLRSEGGKVTIEISNALRI